MSPDTQVSIALIITVISIVFSSINFFSGRRKDLKNENEQFIRISIQLENIQKTASETKEDLKILNDKLMNVIEEQIALRQQVKEIWRRIQKLENKE
ncbi:MAG: hypothetical protein K2P09_02885 [Erysipelotrichales bacterium]|nr:hypothetical protein [Erysipelotrichales bacterium]